MAKVVTITNPVTGQPTQVDQLEHTAQQIDDAADRATGYGLGSSTGRTVSNVSLNSLIENGWYYLYRNNTDGPDGANISDAILFVSSARSDLTKVQRLILGTQGMQGYELRRVYNNSSWLPWEWVNPHMKLGVEYRTTERYQGKPVYTKIINTGTFPAAGGIANKVVINLGIDGTICTVIDWAIVSRNTTGAYVFADPGMANTGLLYWSYIVNGNTTIPKLWLIADHDCSDMTGTVTLRYIKSTD